MNSHIKEEVNEYWTEKADNYKTQININECRKTMKNRRKEIRI